MSVQRRKYDPDFERNAVPLTEEPGRTVIEVAENFSAFPKLFCTNGGANFALYAHWAKQAG